MYIKKKKQRKQRKTYPAHLRNKKNGISSFLGKQKKTGRNRPKYGTGESKKKKQKLGVLEIVKNFLNKIFDLRINHDSKLFFCFLALLLIGIIFVYSSSIYFSNDLTGGNGFAFLFGHIRYVFFGFILALFFYFVRPNILIKMWPAFLIISIGLLGYIVVLSLLGRAENINGATRWLDFGTLQFQPSEFAKLSFVIFLSAFLSKKNLPYKNFKSFMWKFFIPFSFWAGLIVLLILLGKNLATSMVIGFIGLMTYFASMKSKFHIYGFLFLIIVGILVGIVFTYIEGYRTLRYETWTQYLSSGDIPEENRRTTGYQFYQVLIAVGTGGTGGQGLGNSLGKYYFVSTSAGDDNIFAVISEEMGFIGVTALIALYIYLILRLLTIASYFREGQSYYYYTLVSIASWVGFQALIHIQSNVGLMPVTGQTLPYISLGGSSLISLICAMGLALNISKYISTKEQV